MKFVTLPLELTTSIAALVSLHLCTIRDLPGDRMMPSEDSFWLRLEVLLSDRKKSIFHPIQKISSNKDRFTKEGRRAEGATTHVRTSKVRTISPTDTNWPWQCTAGIVTAVGVESGVLRLKLLGQSDWLAYHILGLLLPNVNPITLANLDVWKDLLWSHSRILASGGRHHCRTVISWSKVRLATARQGSAGWDLIFTVGNKIRLNWK